MRDNKLADFIRELSENPEKLVEFQRDPETAMHDAGLSDDDKEIIRSNDETRIAEALGYEAEARFVFRIRNMRSRSRSRFGV